MVKSARETPGETGGIATHGAAPAPISARAAPPSGGVEPSGDNRPTARDRRIAFLVVALTAAIYLRTVAPDFLAGDAGEFHFAAWRLGLSHPTGYPTYQLLGYLWQHALAIFGVSPALALNAMSGIIGALSLGLLYRVMRGWLPVIGPHLQGIGQGAALFTALYFGWNLTFWSQNLIAEVYTLHAFFLLAIFGVAYRLGRTYPAASGDKAPLGPTLILLSGLTGLSLTHHGMTLLVIPALLLFLFVVRPGWYFLRPATWLGILAAGALPLLLYWYIPLRSGPQASPWYHQSLGNETLTLYGDGWEAFVHFITGRSISVGFNSPAEALNQLGVALWLWNYHFGVAGLLLIALGLFVLFRSRSYGILALTGGYAVTQQTFNLFYNIEDILVYYIPLYLMAAIWAGFGAYGLAGAAWRMGKQANEGEPAESGAQQESTGAQWTNRLAWVAMALLFLLPITALASNFPLVDQRGSAGARIQWEAILAAEPPPGAILVTNDRDEMIGLFYVQWVEERRQDLTGLFPLIAPDARFTDIGATLDTALAAQPDAVYLIKEMPGLEVAFSLEAAAPPLVRVVSRHAATPQTRTEVRLGPLLLEGYTLRALGNTEESDPAGEPQPNLEIQLAWRVLEPIARDYTATVQIFDGVGERAGQNDAPPGGVYYPTSLWKPGDQILDTHRLAVDTAALEPGAILLVGMYHAGSMEQLAQPVELEPDWRALVAP